MNRNSCPFWRIARELVDGSVIFLALMVRDAPGGGWTGHILRSAAVTRRIKRRLNVWWYLLKDILNELWAWRHKSGVLGAPKDLQLCL